MEVRIRLKRFGTKKKPTYRIVVVSRTSSTSGKVLDEIGNYRPLSKEKSVSVDKEKLNKWLDKGANLTPAVKKIIKLAT